MVCRQGGHDSWPRQCRRCNLLGPTIPDPLVRKKRVNDDALVPRGWRAIAADWSDDGRTDLATVSKSDLPYVADAAFAGSADSSMVDYVGTTISSARSTRKSPDCLHAMTVILTKSLQFIDPRTAHQIGAASDV